MSVSDWIRGVCAASAAGTAVQGAVPVQRVNMTKARRLVAELDKELNRVPERLERSPVTKSTGRHSDKRRREK
ncbi:MAG: hypothetical protein ACRDRO_27515 [Pseudonocardiaceae bacterium]